MCVKHPFWEKPFSRGGVSRKDQFDKCLAKYIHLRVSLRDLECLARYTTQTIARKIPSRIIDSLKVDFNWIRTSLRRSTARLRRRCWRRRRRTRWTRIDSFCHSGTSSIRSIAVIESIRYVSETDALRRRCGNAAREYFRNTRVAPREYREIGEGKLQDFFLFSRTSSSISCNSLVYREYGESAWRLANK